MNMQPLTYREYTGADMHGILTLWEKYSGWGPLTESQFTSWHMDTPNGECTIIIASTNEGEVIGQMVLRPTEIMYQGKVVHGYRLMAPIIKDDFRGLNIRDYDHPVYAMTRFGINLAQQKKIKILFSIPSLGWVNALKTFPNFGLPIPQIVVLDLMAIDLSKLEIPLAEENFGYVVRISAITHEHEKLWLRFTENNLVTSVNRTAKWLQWRRSSHIMLELRKANHDLVGVMVLKSDGQVLELIADSVETMRTTVIQICQWLNQNKALGISQVKWMLTECINKILVGFPLIKLDFRFAFSYLNPENQQLPPPDQWFLMPDD